MGDAPDNVVPITSNARTAAEKFSADHDRELLTILFTDLVDSTKLQQEAGNVEAAWLVELHRKIVRDELAKYDAREIEWAGDSCLAVFTKPSDAVVFALRMQADHRRVRKSETELPLVRVGMHLGEIVVKKGDTKTDLFGLQVSEAARVMSVARGNQIFCTRAVFDNARGSLKRSTVEGVGEVIWANYGPYLLKGSEDPIELCEIGSNDVAVLKAPEANEKVAPVLPGGIEAMRALIPYEEPVVTAPSRVPRWALALAAALLLTGGILMGRYIPGVGDSGATADLEAPIESLAVLPLDNLMNDPEQDYFVDGMTEAVTAELSKIASLKIISRTSAMAYKNTDKTIPEIADELGVTGLVEGSVLRQGNEVKITVQLIHGPRDEHIWAESYEGTLEDIFQVHSDVALAIADEIRAAVTPDERERVADAVPVNPDALDAYFRGRVLWQSRSQADLQQAAEQFQLAIDLDDSFAPAYAGLADAKNMLAAYSFVPHGEVYDSVKPLALRAINLDPNLAEAYATLGWTLITYEADWQGSRAAYERALALDPNYPTGHLWYGYYLSWAGELDAAREAFKKAMNLDPRSLKARQALAQSLMHSRRFEESLAQHLEILARDPNFLPALGSLPFVYMQLGQLELALESADKQISLRDGDAESMTDKAELLAGMGRTAEAEALFDAATISRDPLDKIKLVAYYNAMGDYARCRELLNGYEVRIDGFTEAISSAPAYDSLRDFDWWWEFLERLDYPPLPEAHPVLEKQQAYLARKAAREVLAAQPKPVVRFGIDLPTDEITDWTDLTFAPDGSRIVIRGITNDGSQLYQRMLNEDDATIRPIEGTVDASDPFFSPDSEWLAFRKDGALWKLQLSSGGVEKIAEGIRRITGATWGDDDTILLGYGTAGLWRLDASDELPVQVTSPDRGRGEFAHTTPRFLPGGRHAIFVGSTSDDKAASTKLLTLDDGTTKTLFTGGMDTRYVPTGHLAYVLDGTLWAVRFDSEALETVGEPWALLSGLRTGYFKSDFSLADDGTLAFMKGDDRRNQNALVWLDTNGDRMDSPMEPAQYDFAHVSPDGRRMAMTIGIRGRNRNWVYDFGRATSFPLRADGPENAMPVWSPDGEWIAYLGGSAGLYRVRPAATADPELIVTAPGYHWPSSWSPDGGELIYSYIDKPEPDSIHGIEPETRRQRVLVQTDANDYLGRVSPNGKWLAYTSEISGRPEIWVQPYPDADAGSALLLTSDGARDSVWARDGSELFYLSANNDSVWAINAPETVDAEWSQPRRKFNLDFHIDNRGTVSSYDVTPDGRFVFVARMGDAAEQTPDDSREIHVVLNWTEELKRLAPRR